MPMLAYHKLITTLLGVGYIPVAPGTFGTLAAFLPCVLLSIYGLTIPLHYTLIIFAISLIMGLLSTEVLIPHWGKDPSKIVIDEFAASVLVIAFVPSNATALISACLLFRFFDILKPLGIGYLDKNLSGAWGVMSDDILAAVYTIIIIQVLMHFQII